MDLVNQVLINKYKIPNLFINLKKAFSVFLIFLIVIQSGCNQINQFNIEGLRSVSGELGKYEKIHKISGSILLKPWSKTQESWNAGGGEYFVLDVGGADIVEYSADEGVIIRFGTQVSDNEFKKLVGRRVELTGNYVSKKPVQFDLHSQYPTDINVEPLHQGSGFKVQSYRIIDE